MANLEAKARVGNTVCSLEELCFPVELIENPVHTNREYSRIVRGQVPVRTELSENDREEYVQNELFSQEMNAAINDVPFVPTEVVAPKVKTELVEMDLNYCSPIYELVPNSDIFPKVVDILERHNIKYSAEFSHTNHARFYGNFTIEDERFSYKMKGTNDVVKFRWNFQHSYNGLTKYKGIAGYYRLVCSNGLTIPVAEMEQYNLCLQGKHTSSILNSLQAFEAIIVNVINDFGKVTGSILNKYEKLGGSWIANINERVEAVLNATKIKMVDNSKFNTLNDITQRIMAEANNPTLGYNGKVNDWLIYNGINAYIYDDNRTITAPEIRREADSKVLEHMLELVG